MLLVDRERRRFVDIVITMSSIIRASLRCRHISVSVSNSASIMVRNRSRIVIIVTYHEFYHQGISLLSMH